MLTKCLYIGTSHTKRKITLLVSRAVVKRKGNIPRTRTSQDLQKCSVLTQGSKQAALHTPFIPQHCARWSSLVSLGCTGGTGNSALLMDGMQRFGVTGKASSFQGHTEHPVLLVGSRMGRVCRRNDPLGGTD